MVSAMADPAIEASQRIRLERCSGRSWGPPVPGSVGETIAIAAAREALEPIRELHKPILTKDPDGYGDYERCSCGFPVWRECGTVLRCYAGEELQVRPGLPKHGMTCRACEWDISECHCWDDDHA